jgi:hypothetical protein
MPFVHVPVAQWIERFPAEEEATGSNPVWDTCWPPSIAGASSFNPFDAGQRACSLQKAARIGAKLLARDAQGQPVACDQQVV